MPENEAYDIANNVGMREAHDDGSSKDSTSDGVDGLEVLRSMRGVRSVTASVGISSVVIGVAAVVSTVGAVLGARSGDSGGVIAGTQALRE